MRPPFNSFQPQARPHRPQQQQRQNNGYSNHNQHNGYQNPVGANQLGMMNPQMMSNPMMGHMNNHIPIPNMPIHPQFFNNLSNMPQQHHQQQQQQLHQFHLPNPINQLLPSLMGNLQYAVANNNLMGGHSLPLIQPNYFQPSQPQLNSFNSVTYPPVPAPHQNHQLRPPAFSEPRPQGQSVDNVNNTNGSGSKRNDFQNKFTKHQNFKGPGQGFQRSRMHQADNAKKKFGFKKGHMRKGNYNDGSEADNIAKETKRRSYVPVYTPQEIQQWRESRRKNFPTKLNVEEKVMKNVSDCILDEEAKIRRQQLQEVLAKQAELGVEVAEVPSHYLSNTDEQVNGGRGDNNKGQFQYRDGKKGRFQNNRHNKRSHGEKDKFSKKPRVQDKNSSQESSVTTRKPTLLEKLLSADIKRDQSQLLQVFRFMVMNSFFKEVTEQQPLELPLIVVDETSCEHASEDPTTEVLCDDSDDDDDDDNDDDIDVDVNGDDESCEKSVE